MTIVSGTYCLPMGGKGTSGNLKIEVVSALPETGRVDRVYFVPIEGATGDNQYTEYIWDRDRQRFEEVGPREIDLTPYATKEALNAVDNRLTSAEAEIVAVQGDVASLDEEISTVVPIVADHTTSITAINDSVEMINADVADLRTTKQDTLSAGSAIEIEDNTVGVAVFDKSKVTVVGSPTISDDGIASGFSANDYIKTGLTSKTVVNTEINILFKMGSLNDVQILCAALVGTRFQISYTDDNMILWFGDGTAWTVRIDNWLSPIQDTEYSVKIVTSASEIKIYVNGALRKTAPQTNFSYDLSSIGIIGSRTYAGILPFNGSIDLKQFSITVDGEQVFSGSKTLYTALAEKQDKLVAGTNINIDGNVISATGEITAEIPPATADTLGGIKVGENLTITEDGVLSANAGGGSVDAYTKAETDELLTGKQDKFTASKPLSIETKTSKLITGYTVSDSVIVPNNNFSIVAGNTICTVTTGSSLTYVDMPIKITSKQVCTVPFGNLADKVSNLLFGYYDGEGRFIPVFSFGCASTDYIQYLALNKTPITTNMPAVSLFSSRMTEGTPNKSISSSTFDKMYFQLYLEGTSLTGFISHKSGNYIYPMVKTFSPTNIDDIALITHVRYCHNNASGPFVKSDFGVYTTGGLVTTTTMTSPIDLSGFTNEFDLSKDLSYKALVVAPATTTSLGVVQPDGTTITVNESGVISAVGGTGGGTQLTSADGETSYTSLALGDNLVVGTGDIAWTNPAMSSASQDGYVITYSNSSTASGAASWKAFDKNTTTSENCWYTGSVSMPQWIMLECPEPVRLTSCMIMNELATPANFKSGYVQGSNDGSSFDTLYTITNRPNTTGYSETYTFGNTTYYKYLRVYFTESHGSGLSIQEIEFKGFVKDASAVPSLNVNLDELGNEVNTLASAVSAVEASVENKQDNLNAELPLSVEVRDIKKLNIDELSTGGILDKDNLTYKATSTMNVGNYGNYGLITKQTFDLSSASTWEFVIKTQLTITRPSGSSSTYARIFGSAATGFECAVQVDDGLVRFGISTDGSSRWTKYTNTSASGLLNNLIWIKVEFTGRAYVWSTSLDGVTYTQRSTYSSTAKMPINTKLCVGRGVNTESGVLYINYHSGTIYLKDSYFIIDGVKTPLAEVVDSASVISASPATTTSLGVVQPDGTTITVNDAGVISANGANIDDTTPSDTTAYSSNKVEDLLMGYVPASTYQELVDRVAALEAAQGP